MSADLDTTLVLLHRLYWREGDLQERLKAVEKRARQRAKGDAYSDDPERDRAVARLARKLRKLDAA